MLAGSGRQPLNEAAFLRDAPKIVWLPLPGRHESFASEVVVILAFVTFAISLVISTSATNLLRLITVTWIFFAVFVAAALFVLGICLFKQYLIRRYWRKYLAETYAGPLLRVIQNAKLPQWMWCSVARAEAVTKKLRSGFAEQGIQTPIVIADIAFHRALANTPSLPGLPEPEPVVNSSRRTISNVVTSLILAAVTISIAFIGGGIICALIGLLFLASGLAPLPPVRRFIRQFRRESKGLVAGPGFAVNSKGAVWTIENSIAFIRAAQIKPKAFASIHLQLMGPMGSKHMSFGSTADPDFLCFWQRWTHPQPRLELAASVAGDMLPS